jgi:hypothetical protein
MMTAKFRRPNESDGIGARMMRKTPSFLVIAGLLAFAAAASASSGAGAAALAASQGIDLWGGPGAKGTGDQGARFDTIVYVTSPAAAAGAVEFFLGGSVVATEAFAVPANGVAAIAAPAILSGKGAFGYHVRSDAAVAAWSETYNENSSGRFGVSLAAWLPTELLAPGDEATGGGVAVSASTEPGRARTNVGVVCAATAAQACRLEVAVFSAGALAGTGTVEAIPGSAQQAALAVLAPGAADKADLALRLRLLSGAGIPYAVRNDNRTSDGTAIPLSLKRNAFSTAPTIVSFTASPASGCAPLETTFSWETVGSAKVSISGVGNDLPGAGSVKTTLSGGGEYLLTATSITGQSSTRSLQLTITPSTPAPTPAPASTMVPTASVVTGAFSAGTGPVTVEFVQQESTGSTFTVQGTSWIYTAGITPGTDVVRITATGSCGSASAEFTAIVVSPGTPRILSFESIPSRGCAPSTNVLLTWRTEEATGVHVSGINDFFGPNSGIDTTLTGTTSFTLTAFNDSGAETTSTLTVPVDPKRYDPVPVPGLVNVLAGTTVEINIHPASVPSFDGVRFFLVQRPTGSMFWKDPYVPGRYFYQAGRYSGTDIIRFLWVNGCGYGYGNFTAVVTGDSAIPEE